MKGAKDIRSSARAALEGLKKDASTIATLAERVRAEMMTLVSAVTRSTVLPLALGAVGCNLDLCVFRLESALSGIAVAELDGLPPFRTAEASLHGITHQLLGRDLSYSGSLQLNNGEFFMAQANAAKAAANDD